MNNLFRKNLKSKSKFKILKMFLSYLRRLYKSCRNMTLPGSSRETVCDH